MVCGVFAVICVIVACACFGAAVRLFTRMPSTIAVYPSGLGWVTRGQERKIPWADVTHAERNVREYFLAGKLRRSDALRLVFADGKSVLIWAGVLTDYDAFANSVQHLHECAGFKSAWPASAKPCSVVTKRCWHCGYDVEVKLSNIPVNVSCPGCRTSLGMVRRS